MAQAFGLPRVSVRQVFVPSSEGQVRAVQAGWGVCVLPELHVRELEASADDAAVAEQRLDLARPRLGGDVEVLGQEAEQQVADAAADQVGLDAPPLQARQHADRIRVQGLAGDGNVLEDDGLDGVLL